MPKSKEQKQQEALERQAKSVKTTLLRELIQLLPGGSCFYANAFGDVSVQNVKNAVIAFGKFRGACFQHGVKIPGNYDHGSFNDLEFLLKNTTPLWIGTLVSVYEQELQKTTTRDQARALMLQQRNAAGKAVEEGKDSQLRHEIRGFKDALKSMRSSNEEQMRAVAIAFRGVSSSFFIF